MNLYESVLKTLIAIRDSVSVEVEGGDGWGDGAVLNSQKWAGNLGNGWGSSVGGSQRLSGVSL